MHPGTRSLPPTCQECPVSVLDQFRDAEQRVAQRLKELEPAVAEYRELKEVAQRLGIDQAETTATPAGATRAPRRRRATRSRPTRTTGNGTAPSPRQGGQRP